MTITLQLQSVRRRGRPRKQGERYPSNDLKPMKQPAPRGRPPGIARPMVLLEPPTPEKRLGMTRADAMTLIGPLLPQWKSYACAPPGEVAYAPEMLRAALLLHELGFAIIAQRRNAGGGIDYLIRRRRLLID